MPFPEQPPPQGHRSGTEDGATDGSESTPTERSAPQAKDHGRKSQRELEDRQWEAQRERQEVQRGLEERQRQAQLERQEAQRGLEERQRQAQRARQEAQREIERKQRPGGGSKGSGPDGGGSEG